MKNHVYLVLTGSYDESENVVCYYDRDKAIEYVRKIVGDSPDIWNESKDPYNDNQILHARINMDDHHDWIVEKLEIR